jgi:hypothetical protein
MCELYVTCDVCMLNPIRSWLYVGESLKSLVISWTTGFILAQVRKYNYLGSYHCTCARINWMILSQIDAVACVPPRR